MAFDTFLFLEGISGESSAMILQAPIQGVKPFEITSWNFGAANPSSVGSGAGGLSAGKVHVSSFNVQKKSENASPQLFLNCCTGQHISKGAVIMRKATGGAGKQQTFWQFMFTEVMVDSIQWSGHAGGDDTPEESISFAFAKVDVQYWVQDPIKGDMNKGTAAAWDITKVIA